MCSICLCEHQKERHKTNTTHITTIIKGVLDNVRAGRDKPEELRRQVETYSIRAEELMNLREMTRRQLEEKLQKLRTFYKTQKVLVASTNSALLNCNEKILKDTQNCEYRIKESIKDPKKIERRVNEMILKEDYWLAYEEAEKALVDEVVFDDKEIKEQFTKGQTMIKEYQDQLLALDTITLHIKDYNRIVETNATIKGKLIYY